MVSITGQSSAFNPTPIALRKRLNMLDRAHSLSNITTFSQQNGNILSSVSQNHNHKQSDTVSDDNRTHDHDETCPSSYESHSDSETDEFAERSVGSPTISSPRTPSDEHGHANTRYSPSVHNANKPTSTPKSTAWYEFDLAVVAALVSPIGNWLTGGDHIKNLILIILLIFYLHQIIEVPWHLYHAARPHVSAPRTEVTTHPGKDDQLAISELRRLELFFLSLTVLSPFFGALLLRYVTAAVLGPDAVSWFSTGLFVLATGMRPWTHLVDRLASRTRNLQDIVHTPQSPTIEINSMQRDIEEMRQQIEVLTGRIGDVRREAQNRTEEIYAYIDDSVDVLENSVHKMERRGEREDARIKGVEATLLGITSGEQSLGKGKGKGRSLSVDVGSGLLQGTKAITQSTMERILPLWLLTPTNYQRPVEPPSPSRRSLHSFPSSPNLETITEEDPLSINAPAGPATLTGKNNSINSLTHTYRLLAQPSHLASSFVYNTGYILTLPLRATVRMILRRY